MQDEIQNPIIVQPVKRKRISFLKRAQADRAKFKKARQLLAFAQELNLAGVSPKAKSRSLIEQYHVTTREARVAIKLSKPKKHRSRRS